MTTDLLPSSRGVGRFTPLNAVRTPEVAGALSEVAHHTRGPSLYICRTYSQVSRGKVGMHTNTNTLGCFEEKRSQLSSHGESPCSLSCSPNI